MRVCNIEKLDRGFILQTEASENAEGMRAFIGADEVLAEVAVLLGVNAAVVATTPEPTKVVPIWEAAGVPAPTPGTIPEPATETASSPDVLNDYDAEIHRLVSENDRKAAKARLDALVEQGMIEPYGPRILIKKMVELIIKGDANTAAVPAPKHPGGVTTTLDDVKAALQAAAQRMGQLDAINGPAQVMMLLSSRGITKVSDAPANLWEALVNEANAMGV